jgi:uncharacterized membrane protein YphA (DoxX/SURF4 family)
MSNAVLLPLLYAGLAGTLLALIIASAQQKWSLRVFFLLALRLAIGWHFLFEGLHKIHSHMVGPAENNRVFSSEPYFKVAQGPLGPLMRKQFGDTEAIIDSQVKAAEPIKPEEFAKKSDAEQAKYCPQPVGNALDVSLDDVEETIKAEAAGDLKSADVAEKKAVAAANIAEERELRGLRKDDVKSQANVKAEAEAERAKAKKDAEKARTAAKVKGDKAKEFAPLRVVAAKAAYARWVYGVDGRDTKLKGISTDVPYTAPERLAHIERVRGQAQAEEERQAAHLGNGFGIEQKKAAELRLDLVAAESDLAKDAQTFTHELKKFLIGKKADDEPPAQKSWTQRWMDPITMWFIAGIGACLMAGLLTRLACILGAGFLVMTYLAHPAFPWLPLPPNTEGNPVFINKNIIEALALLTLATFPTGRWLGIDALLGRLCGCGRSKAHGQPSVGLQST